VLKIRHYAKPQNVKSKGWTDQKQKHFLKEKEVCLIALFGQLFS
jgi:hypothetical protein